MTTRVLIVNQGPEHDIDVFTVSTDPSATLIPAGTVHRNSHREFHVWDTQHLIIKEKGNS